MNINHIRYIIVSVCLGCLAPSLALAQFKITTQPIDRFVDPGKNTSFSVSSSGVGPFAYQWLFNGMALVDATNRIFYVTNAQAAQSGYYSVLVSNASGSVTSQVALLKVFVSAPHDFSSIEVRSDRSASLTFTGEATALFGRYYDLYPLETSSNLVDWTPLTLLQRTNAALDTLQFLDTDAAKFGQRFYRLATNLWVTPLPQSTGPYSVGTLSMLLTDPSRTNKVRHTNQQFMVTFSYPTFPQAGVVPASFVEKEVAANYNMPVSIGAGGNFATQVVAFYSHSLSNAPIATNLVKYPVVLYSPGYGGHRRENTDKVEDLASWGYVVVAMDHIDTFLSVFPDGKVVHGQGSISSTRDAVASIEGRLRDEQFVLDELEHLNANDPHLGGRLDLDKIGTFGWSIGGATAAQLCLRDPRCKAGVNFDGTFFESNLLTNTLSVPYLCLVEGESPQNDSPPNNDILPVFNHMLTNAYWVKLTSTVHGSFSDFDLIIDSASLQAVWGTPVSGQYLRPARVTQIVRTYLLSFFNKYLKGEDDHLLDGPSADYPEVEQFIKK